jgi:tetratricopeptide (TPR) repeat protein
MVWCWIASQSIVNPEQVFLKVRSKSAPIRNVYFHRLILFCAFCLAGLAFGHPGQHEQLQHINRSIAQSPDAQDLYIRRGAIYSNGGEFEPAIADFDRAAQLGSPTMVALERGVLYYRMGDFERAIQYLDQYIEHFPRTAIAHEYRFRCNRDAGNYADAVDDLNRYFEVHENPHPGNYIAAATMLDEMGKTDEAFKVLDAGLDKIGLTPQLQRHAIKLELENQRPENAIIRLETLRKPLKENPGWKVDMAELLLLVNRRAEAENLLTEAATELGELRPTPARLALIERAGRLRQQIKNTKK